MDSTSDYAPGVEGRRVEAHRSRLLERLTEPSTLLKLLASAEGRLECTPGDPVLRRRRAEFLRALGDLDGALDAYAALSAEGAGDEATGRCAAVLSGRTPVDGPGPGLAPFVRVEGLLNADQLALLWRTVSGPDACLQAAGVFGEGGPTINPGVRQARIMEHTEALSGWFLPIVEAVIDREHALSRLGLSPFAVTRRELQVTRHEAGGFYRMHRDAGPKASSRYLTYVYYFHREPRRFTGGDLLLFDQTAGGARSDLTAFTRIRPIHNSMLLFASDRLHAVSRVEADGPDPLDGRWTVNGWLHRAPLCAVGEQAS